MHARTIANLLFPLLVASGLAAQKPGQDPLAAEMTALLLEQVQGDAAAAEAEVGKALAKAAAKDRPRLLLRRVLLLEKLGRAAEAQAALGQLAQEPPPFGPWAASRLGGAAATSTRSDPGAPLASLVAQLDYPDTQPMVGQARNELTRLGPLAVPALLKHLDSLGLYGLRNALGLLCQYPDLGVVPAFERLLADPDPVRQLTAAQALVQLPLAVRKPLATRLLEGTQNTWLRLAALEALAEDPAERGRLAAECARMEASDTRAQTRLASLLAGHPLPGNAEVLRWLEVRAAGEEWSSLVPQALTAFALNLGEDGEAAALALLDRIPKDTRARGLFLGLRHRRGPVWPRARVRELACFPEDVSGKIQRLRVDGIEPTSEELVGLLKLQPAQEQWCREVRSYALTTLTARKDKAGVPAAIRLLGEEDLFLVVQYLAVAAPEELEQRIGSLILRQTQNQSHVTERLVRFARDRALSAAVGPAVERMLQDGGNAMRYQADVLELVARRSGPEDLPLVLELARERQTAEYVDAACQALSRWFDLKCVPTCIERLPTLAEKARGTVVQKTCEVAAGAETVLGSVLAQALRLNTRDRWALTSTLVAALGRIGSQAVVPILEPLLVREDPALQPQLQVAAWQALRENSTIDRRAVLAGLLKRKNAVHMLSLLLSEPIVAQDEALRRAAIECLREAKDWDGGEELMSFLSRLPVADRIALATEILDARDQGPGSMARLVGAALTTLGELRDEALLPLMARALKHRNRNVRELAIQQIGNTFALNALPHLLEGMKDEIQSNADLAVKYTERISKYLEQKKQIDETLKQSGK